MEPSREDAIDRSRSFQQSTDALEHRLEVVFFAMAAHHQVEAMVDVRSSRQSLVDVVLRRIHRDLDGPLGALWLVVCLPFGRIAQHGSVLVLDLQHHAPPNGLDSHPARKGAILLQGNLPLCLLPLRRSILPVLCVELAERWLRLAAHLGRIDRQQEDVVEFGKLVPFSPDLVAECLQIDLQHGRHAGADGFAHLRRNDFRDLHRCHQFDGHARPAT
mmetsp:Transcript_7587/g.22120  ORF Transcript_7587/g.22120 Transcript_7587/m.22120 type:complete len:217 (+) Transcript_7587:352-1002(+)